MIAIEGIWFCKRCKESTRILYIDDRDTVETPADVAGKNGIEIHFKNKSKSGITSDGTWTAVIMLDGYSDVSGGYPMELGFSMSDLSDSRPLYLRTPKSSTEWGAWRTILDSKTYTNFGNDGVTYTPFSFLIPSSLCFSISSIIKATSSSYSSPSGISKNNVTNGDCPFVVIKVFI